MAEKIAYLSDGVSLAGTPYRLYFKMHLMSQAVAEGRSTFRWEFGIESSTASHGGLFLDNKTYTIVLGNNTFTGKANIMLYTGGTSYHIAEGYWTHEHYAEWDVSNTFNYSFRQNFYCEADGIYLDEYGGSGYAYVDEPATLAPTCSITVSDPTGVADIYGDYVYGKSKFCVEVTAWAQQSEKISDATITPDACSVTINGVTTNNAFNVITDFIKATGDVEIGAKVVDSYGRIGTATITINVIGYSIPAVPTLKVERCTKDGTLDLYGEYIKATFSAIVTPLNNKNQAQYRFDWKKSSEDVFSSYRLLSDYNGNYTPTNATCIFGADISSSYDVQLTVTDGFGSVYRATVAPTAFVLMHFAANGTSLGLGKTIAEDDINLLDIGFRTRFSGGLQLIEIPHGSYLNEYKTPGFYVGLNTGTAEYSNCPLESGTFLLEVYECGGNGEVMQRLTLSAKASPVTFERFFYEDEWGEWLSDKIRAYPVGSIYVSANSTSPASLFGGTWERIKDKFLLAAGDSYSAGSTGGEANVTLTIDTMPAHGHDAIEVSGQALYWTQNPSTTAWGKTAVTPNTGSTTDSENKQFATRWTGGGAAHNNMPPYLAVYVWKRTA